MISEVFFECVCMILAGLGMARRREARSGRAWLGKDRFVGRDTSATSISTAWQGKARLGPARPGAARAGVKPRKLT